MDILKNQKVKNILIEMHPTLLPLFGSSQDYIKSTLKNLGFTNKIIGKRGDQTHLLFF